MNKNGIRRKRSQYVENERDRYIMNNIEIDRHRERERLKDRYILKKKGDRQREIERDFKKE